MTTEHPQLQFSDVDVYYNYVFDLGRHVNPIDAARRILGTDLGQAFRNYVTGKSEVADRHKGWVEAYEKLQQLRDDVEKIETGQNLAGRLKLLLSNPRLYGGVYLHALRADFSSPNHQEESDREEEEDSDIESFIDDEVAEAIIDLLGLLAFQEHVDHEIFYSGYMETVPFARVGLQPFGVVIDEQEIVFDVTLTIHRSGIAILTAYGVFSGSMPLDQALRLQRGTKLPVKEFDLPSCAIQRYLSLLTGYTPNQKQIREFETSNPSTHQGYVRLEGDEESVLGAAFDTYRYFVIETIHEKKYRSIDDLHNKLRSRHWHAYPMVFIKRTDPSYLSATDFKEVQSEALARLVVGLNTSSILKPKLIAEICEQDLSIVDDYSLYLTEGSGTAIYYENFLKVPQSIAANEWIRQKFLTTVVVDMLLLQKGILSTFNVYLDKATYDASQLNALKKEYLLGLEEFEALKISYYGSVHDIIKRGQEICRIDDLRSLFLVKLDSIEGLIKVAEKRQQARRERIVKFLTTLAATILALKAAQDVVDVLLRWPSSAPSAYPAFIRSAYSITIDIVIQHPTTVTLVLYFMIVFMTLVALWHQRPGGLRQRKRVLEDHAIPKSPERTVSPMSFMVSAHTESDDKDDGNG